MRISIDTVSLKERFMLVSGLGSLLACSLLFSMQVRAGEEGQDAGQQDAQPTNTVRQEMQALGQSLKAAVMSGQMDGDEAKALWDAVMAEVKGGDRNRNDVQKERESLQGNEEPKAYIGRLIPPDPTRPSRLLEPEFLPRDVQFLANRLDLDSDRAGIVENIIRDYTRAFETASASLPEAIERYQMMEAQRKLEDRIAQLDRTPIFDDRNMDQAIDVLSQQVREYAEASVAKEGGDAEVNSDEQAEIVEKRSNEWTSELASGLENFNERMSSLRARMQARLDQVQEVGEVVTADDLVRLAKQLQLQRRDLKADVIEMLQVILVLNDTEVEQAALDDALAELELRHGLRHARMGGEFINPWSVIIDTYPDRNIDPAANLALEEYKPLLAATIEQRSRLAISREIKGLEMIEERDALITEYGDEENVDRELWLKVIEPFSKSWERQIDASINYRDQLLDLVNYTNAVLAEQNPEAAERYRVAAMRQGFAPEMRTRWCQRALKAALELDDLNEVTLIILDDLQANTAMQLRAIQDESIRKRMKRDAELARQPVLSLWGMDPEAEKPWIVEDWAGQEYAAHSKLNEQTESTLRSILTPAQFEQLPKRRVQKEGAEKGKGNAKEGKGRRGQRGSGKGKGAANGGGKGGK
ncbi:MAG: hypothetical protein CMJ39_07110 [Phycisphaerae bacterium]|nr:hypothetical protein [Phycisphaerae bacterium]